MGFWDRIRGFIAPEDKSARLIKDYNMDDLIKESRLQFKETITIEDTILEKYKKYEKVDFQKEILEKHLNTAQDEMLRFEQEQQLKNEISEEVDKTLEGQDEETKEKVKEDLLKEEQEDAQEGKEKKTDPKERKKQLEAKVCKAAYGTMYGEYTRRAMQIKGAMRDEGELAMTTEHAVEMIAYEKSLEKLEVMYHNRTGKEFSSDEEINKKRQEFKKDFEIAQSGTDKLVDERVNKINRLYAIKKEAHERYMEALYRGNVPPAKLAMMKQTYQEAASNLVQAVPSLQEYMKEIQAQQKNEDLARDKNIGNESAIKNKIDVNAHDEKLTRNDSKIEDKIMDTQQEKASDERYMSKKVMANEDARNYEYARNKTEEKVTEENLANRTKMDVSDTKESIKKDMIDDRSDFLRSLSNQNQLDTPTKEQLESDAYYDPEKARAAAEEERQKEESLRKKDEEMVREIKNKKNHNNYNNW